MTRILFLPAWLDGLPRSSASPRIRCEWVCKYWDEAEVYNGTQSLAEYDVLVFQKAYLTADVQQWAERYDALKVADICDPEWLDPAKRTRLHRHLELMDLCVAPTPALAEWLAAWLPTVVIPDGIDLDLHQPRTGDEEPYFADRVGLVWFGGSQNYGALETLLPVTTTMGLPVATISDKPYPHCPFIRWEGVRQCNEWLKRFDVVLNPQPDWGDFQYKSNNKTLTAWALGLPVAGDARQLQRLVHMTDAERQAEGRLVRDTVERQWDVRLMVEKWREVLEHTRGTNG